MRLQKRTSQFKSKDKDNKLALTVRPKILTLAIAQALALQAVQAATIEVTRSVDDNGAGCTLREAVTSVNNGALEPGCSYTGTFGSNDTITISPIISGSTITLALGNLNITGSMSINPGGSDTTISGNNTDRVIVSSVPGVELTLDHLILTQGNAGGGSGGAILVSDNTLNLLNSTISASTAGNDGGGLDAYNATVSLIDSTVSGNTADYEGGGVHINYYSSAVLNGSTVSGNSAGYYGGGGIYIDYYSSAVLNNSTVSGNTAYYDGGGIYVKDHSTATLTNSTVSGNTSTNNDAGGIRVDDFSTLSLINSMVSGNSAYDKGGAIYIDDDSSATITNSTISGNSSDDEGGGIWIDENSKLSLVDSTVSGNSADATGGGIHIDYDSNEPSTLTVTNSTISGNTSDVRGGGVFIDDGDNEASLTNSTVSGNTATQRGGGVHIDDSTVLFVNSTINENTVTTPTIIASDGNNLQIINSTVGLRNTVVANAIGGADCAANAASTVGASSTNIIESDFCSTSAQNIDPGLMPLANNGGPTETHALMPGSPAIDAGNNATCEATDQRGEARNDGACDIGAYEFKATVMPIAKKDRKMGSLMSNGEQWYSFNSTELQKLSMQTNGFMGDTLLDFYTGNNPKTASALNNDDDSGPDLFSNIKHNANNGPYLIRVKAKTDVDPYWLRLMSDKDILSFNDTNTHFANKEIRVMSSAGITGGCGVNQYCPTDPVTRAQMAIFMLKAILGGNHNSPAATGTVFNDVSTSSFGANFIEEFSTLGITSGCGGGKYCPDLAVTREQMAVFLLRAWYGSSYTPPAATPAEINQFSDIANSFAKDWIVQLTKENITGGCGGGKFCPTDTVTRGQMAAFITRTFSLDTEL